MLLTPAQIKPKSFESRRNSSFFLPGVDAPHVYGRAWALGCFQSYQYPNKREGADRVGGQLRGDKECPFSGLTKSGRVWRKVPESDARSVISTQTFWWALTVSPVDSCAEIKSAPNPKHWFTSFLQPLPYLVTQ